jgi:transmembrane sensor
MDAGERRGRAAEEAAEWWVRLQESGEVSRAEHEAYVDWLRESALHVAEMLQIARLHGSLAQFDRWAHVPTHDSGEAPANVLPLPVARRPEAARDRARDLGRNDVQTSPPVPVKRRSPAYGAIAASLAAALLVVGLARYLARGQVIQTERGERRELALEDGSVVQIDPETRLRVRYETRARYVELERGRALFHVARNVGRPFLVEAAETTVRAVGTAFAVERASDRVVVTVAEGKVAVFPTRSAATAADPAAVRNESSSQAGPSSPAIDLTVNEQLAVRSSGGVEPVREVDSARALAWAEGRLIFQNDSVAQAVREFNRYNRIQLAVSEPALAERRISGVFSASDPESFVAFLESAAGVHVRRDASSTITIDAR